MSKRKKPGFARLAVYAASATELRRVLETVEVLARTVIDLRRMVGELGVEVGRLKAVPTPRRRRPAADQPAGAVAAIPAAQTEEGGG